MAGGIGSRFWPLSRTKKPKQFLDILGTGRTLLQQTFDRLRKVIPVENILIVTNEDYEDLVRKQLPEIATQTGFAGAPAPEYGTLHCLCQSQDTPDQSRCKDSGGPV